MKIMPLYCHFILEENEDFEAVVLLRSTLWTALVALHYLESFGLEKSGNIPSRLTCRVLRMLIFLRCRKFKFFYQHFVYKIMHLLNHLLT